MNRSAYRRPAITTTDRTMKAPRSMPYHVSEKLPANCSGHGRVLGCKKIQVSEKPSAATKMRDLFAILISTSPQTAAWSNTNRSQKIIPVDNAKVGQQFPRTTATPPKGETVFANSTDYAIYSSTAWLAAQ